MINFIANNEDTAATQLPSIIPVYQKITISGKSYNFIIVFINLGEYTWQNPVDIYENPQARIINHNSGS